MLLRWTSSRRASRHRPCPFASPSVPLFFTWAEVFHLLVTPHARRTRPVTGVFAAPAKTYSAPPRWDFIWFSFRNLFAVILKSSFFPNFRLISLRRYSGFFLFFQRYELRAARFAPYREFARWNFIAPTIGPPWPPVSCLGYCLPLPSLRRRIRAAISGSGGVFHRLPTSGVAGVFRPGKNAQCTSSLGFHLVFVPKSLCRYSEVFIFPNFRLISLRRYSGFFLFFQRQRSPDSEPAAGEEYGAPLCWTRSMHRLQSPSYL